jgi:protein SCO1/2
MTSFALVAGGVAVAKRHVDRPSSAFAGQLIPDGTVASQLALRNQDGHLVRLSRLQGKVVLVSFLYTSCRDVCPMIAKELDTTVASLGAYRDQVRVLAVSVDPKGDTPSAARAYKHSHHLSAQFDWLVGSRSELAPVWQAYNVQVERRGIDTIAHTTPVFLIDGKAVPRVFYPPPQSQEAITHDLRLLLGELTRKT